MSKEKKNIDKAQEEELQSVNYIDIKPEDKKSFNTIGEIMNDILDSENNIQIPNAMVAMTVLIQGIRSVYKYLEENRSKTEYVSVNLGDYLELGIEYRESDDEEKDGNFTIVAKEGLKGKIDSKSDDVSEE